MYPPFIFVKKQWIYWRHGVDVSDDDDKMFSVLIILCQQVTHNKTINEGNFV